MRALAAKADKPRFRVEEIFMPVDSPEQTDKVKKSRDELESQLRMGAPFAAVARQFSQNPTAAQGGDLGWISPGQLQPELDKVLVDMRPGSVSDPIRAAGGYYILALREREEPAGTKLPEQTTPKYPPGELPLARVLRAVRETDAFKFNVNLVLIYRFLRFGLVDQAGTEGRDLRAARDDEREIAIAAPLAASLRAEREVAGDEKGLRHEVDRAPIVLAEDLSRARPE